MKDLDKAKKILGVNIIRSRLTTRIWLSQDDSIMKLLKRFNMIDCTPITIPLGAHLELTKKNNQGIYACWQKGPLDPIEF